MEAVKYQVWYWFIFKGMRYDHSDKKMAITGFKKFYGRDPRPAEIAVKRIPIDNDE